MAGSDVKPDPAPHYLGHRERLKARFQTGGADGLADYELLELMLFQTVPRRDTKPIAKALLDRFGSFSQVLSAPDGLLMEIPGVGEAVAQHLKVVQAAAQRFARDAVGNESLLDSWAAVIDYCRTVMAYEQIEQFRVLFLDRKNRLIADESPAPAPSTTHRSTRAKWSSARWSCRPPR